jgi:hypothetical protein
MDDFFNQVLNDLDTLKNKLLRYRYLYIHDIMVSKDINYILGGNDINALISYIKLLFEKNGDSSKIAGPLGDKFFLEDDEKYKNIIFNNFNNNPNNNPNKYQRYFANEISEKEYNLSDISAQIYLLSLIILFIYIIYRGKKYKKF